MPGRLAARRRPRAWSPSGSPRTPSTRSRPCASCTTRPRPASPAGSPEVRAAIDDAGHPALLLVDTISSLGSIDYRHDEWGVDVTVAGSQKGLMLPPGLGFNAVSEKALAASESAGLPRSYWDWEPIIAANENGFWPYTPAHQPALRPAGRAADARRRGPAATSSPGTSGTPQRPARPCAAWGLEVLCARRARALGVADRGPACPRGTTPTRYAGSSSTASTCPWAPGSASSTGTDLPHRPPRPLQRPDAGRHAGRRADGPAARRRADRAGAASRPRSPLLEKE